MNLNDKCIFVLEVLKYEKNLTCSTIAKKLKESYMINFFIKEIS